MSGGQRRPRRRLLDLLYVLVSGCSLLPEHPVPPHPANIRAAVSTGDTVVVTTSDGMTRTLAVRRIDATGIRGDDDNVRFSEIESIAVRSAIRPKNLCNDGTPVGCSVPQALTVSVDRYSEYARRFESACISHDYCYRHGLVTYGHERAACDEAFLDDMRSNCGGRLDLDLSSRADCLLAAQEFYVAVRQAGADRFLGTAGSYCEFRGPP